MAHKFGFFPSKKLLSTKDDTTGSSSALPPKSGKAQIMLAIDIKNSRSLSEYRGYAVIGQVEDGLSLEEVETIKGVVSHLITSASIIVHERPFIHFVIDYTILEHLKTSHRFSPRSGYERGFCVDILRIFGLAPWQINNVQWWTVSIGEIRISEPLPCGHVWL